MRLILTRHGESVANVERVFANTEDDKYPLTAKGRLQAERLAAQLAGERLTAIYSSPLLRARQTAEIIGLKHGLELLTHEGLREVGVGRWEGLSYDGEDEWRLQEMIKVHGLWFTNQSPLASSAGGENKFNVQTRLSDFIRHIRQYYDDRSSLLVVTHGGLLMVALPLLVPDLTTMDTKNVVDHCQIIEIEYSLNKSALGY